MRGSFAVLVSGIWNISHLVGTLSRRMQFKSLSALHTTSWSVYSLFLFLWLAPVCGPLLFICIQFRFSVQLVLGEEENMFSRILHALQISSLTLALSPLEMWHRYVSILGILWLTFRGDGWETENKFLTTCKTNSWLKSINSTHPLLAFWPPVNPFSFSPCSSLSLGAWRGCVWGGPLVWLSWVYHLVWASYHWNVHTVRITCREKREINVSFWR